IAGIKSQRDMAALVAQLPLPFGRTILFAAGSTQDPDNSDQEIANLDQGGLALPDRDYYTKEDAKSKEIRERYVQHVQKVFELLGDNPQDAKQNADTILRMETALAKASWTQAERRDPYKLKKKMKLGALEQLPPYFYCTSYYRALQCPPIEILSVDALSFYKVLNAELAREPLQNWKNY